MYRLSCSTYNSVIKKTTMLIYLKQNIKNKKKSYSHEIISFVFNIYSVFNFSLTQISVNNFNEKKENKKTCSKFQC